MLVAEDDDGFAFGEPRLNELDGVADGANVAWVGMKRVLRPMLGLCAIVTEGPKEFELYCPRFRNNQITLLATTRIPFR